MSEPNDDGKMWGFMEAGVFVILPKGPMIEAGLGPPPFDVRLPGGEVRRVIHRPDSAVA